MSTRKRTREEAQLGHSQPQHSQPQHGQLQHSSVGHTNGNGVQHNKPFATPKHMTPKKDRALGLCSPAPFSDEPEAIYARKQCDYSIRITQEMARIGQAPRLVRIYSDGIYDLFHQGHARQLMQAKCFFPEVYLIVGVSNDHLTHQNKGRTVMDDSERFEAVRHCRYVDEVVRDAPWVLDDEFIQYHKIDFVAHDDVPYTLGTTDDVYARIKERGMFLTTQRTDGISTSDLVARIVKDYDLYVRRNLARGYKAKDMNVSFLNEKKFLLQNKMDELKDKGKLLVENFDSKRHGFIQKWEDKSREFINNFLDLFGRDGRINHFWQESKGKIRQALSPNNSPPGSPRSRSSSPAAKIFKSDTSQRLCDPEISDEDEEDYVLTARAMYDFNCQSVGPSPQHKFFGLEGFEDPSPSAANTQEISENNDSGSIHIPEKEAL